VTHRESVFGDINFQMTLSILIYTDKTQRQFKSIIICKKKRQNKIAHKHNNLQTVLLCETFKVNFKYNKKQASQIILDFELSPIYFIHCRCAL